MIGPSPGHTALGRRWFRSMRLPGISRGRRPPATAGIAKPTGCRHLRLPCSGSKPALEKKCMCMRIEEDGSRYRLPAILVLAIPDRGSHAGEETGATWLTRNKVFGRGYGGMGTRC